MLGRFRLTGLMFSLAFATGAFADDRMPVLRNEVEIAPPALGQGMVVLSLVDTGLEPRSGIVIQRIGEGEPRRETLFEERGKPRARAARVVGGAVSPGIWRIIGVAAIVNDGTEKKPLWVERPTPIAFLAPGLGEFEVKAGGVTDLGVLHTRLSVGDINLLLRGDDKVVDLPFSSNSHAASLARTRVGARSGWTHAVTDEERAAIALERAAVAGVEALSESEVGELWAGGAYGRVFAREPNGNWRSYRVPGEPWLSVVTSYPGGVIVGGRLGAVALLKEGRFVPLSVEGLVASPIVKATCDHANNCIVAQISEAVDDGSLVRRVDVMRWTETSGWSKAWSGDARGSFMYGPPQVWLEQVEGKIIVQLNNEKAVHAISATDGSVSDGKGSLPERNYRGLIHRGFGDRVVRHAIELQGFASNVVQMIEVSVDGGKNWSEERPVPPGQIVVSKTQQLFAAAGTPNDGYSGFTGLNSLPSVRNASQVHTSTDDGRTWTLEKALYSARPMDGGGR